MKLIKPINQPLNINYLNIFIEISFKVNINHNLVDWSIIRISSSVQYIPMKFFIKQVYFIAFYSLLVSEILKGGRLLNSTNI